MKYYERIDGRQVPVENEEDIKTAEFMEMCDMIDGTVGLLFIGLIVTILTVLV
tara:strand:+ start:529 stop:687 length:159 start_codon:yes stop_codon:yes gene_type:complete